MSLLIVHSTNPYSFLYSFHAQFQYYFLVSQYHKLCILPVKIFLPTHFLRYLQHL